MLGQAVAVAGEAGEEGAVVAVVAVGVGGAEAGEGVVGAVGVVAYGAARTRLGYTHRTRGAARSACLRREGTFGR